MWMNLAPGIALASVPRRAVDSIDFHTTTTFDMSVRAITGTRGSRTNLLTTLPAAIKTRRIQYPPGKSCSSGNSGSFPITRMSRAFGNRSQTSERFPHTPRFPRIRAQRASREAFHGCPARDHRTCQGDCRISSRATSYPNGEARRSRSMVRRLAFGTRHGLIGGLDNGELLPSHSSSASDCRRYAERGPRPQVSGSISIRLLQPALRQSQMAKGYLSPGAVRWFGLRSHSRGSVAFPARDPD